MNSEFLINNKALQVNKQQLIDAVNNHPKFNAERLCKMADGKRLTENILWAFLCELEDWEPLEIEVTPNPDWVLVASTSQIGVWYHTSAIHQACDCPFSDRRTTPCCHLSAAMRREEAQWIAKAAHYGFVVTVSSGKYLLSTDGQPVGELSFDQNGWWLAEPRRPAPIRFDGINEVIEYLNAVVSFGWQIG